MNLVCRDESLKTTVMERLNAVFSAVFVVSIQSEVNETVFAIKRTSDSVDKATHLSDIKQAVKRLNSYIHKKANTSETDTFEALDNLQIR